MSTKTEAVQLINQLVINRQNLGRSCSVEAFEAERLAFRKGCKELSGCSDPDVQQVVAFLLTHGNPSTLGLCKAWKRLIAA